MPSKPYVTDLHNQAGALIILMDNLLKTKLDAKQKASLEKMRELAVELTSGLKDHAKDLRFFGELLATSGLTKFMQAGGDEKALLLKLGLSR